MNTLDPAKMREQFQLLNDERATIVARSAPLRAQRDALLAEYEPKVRALEKQYLAIEKDLGSIDAARAALARALKGKTA